MTKETRLNEMALRPLGFLHSEGWGPDAIEVDPEEEEVKFVFKNAVDVPDAIKEGLATENGGETEDSGDPEEYEPSWQ